MVEALVIGVLFLAQIQSGVGVSRFKYFLWSGLGALIPLLLTGLYFARFGLFSQLMDATLWYNFSYGTIKTAAQNPFARIFGLLGGLAWIAALGFVFAAFRFYVALKNKTPDAFLYLFLAAGAPACVLLSDLSQKGFEHYFINALPLLGFLAGLVFHIAMEFKPVALNEKSALILAASLFVLASAFFVFSGAAKEYFFVSDFYASGFFVRNQQTTTISQYVIEHSEPADTVLFWGAFPNENFLSSRAAASSVLFYPILAPSAVTDELNARYLADVKSNPPALIVDLLDPYLPALDSTKRAQQFADLPVYFPDNLEELFAYVQSHYVFKKAVAGKDVYYRVK